MTTSTHDDQAKATDVSNVNQEADGKDVPAGYWINGKGDLVHVSRVKPADKLREKFVQRWFKRAEAMNREMSQFKLDLMGDMQAYLDELADIYKTTMRGAKGKGNISLITYAGHLKIERSVQETIAFDERLQLAKAKASECVQRWSKGANRNLQAIVQDAFDVDAAGNINISRVLGLRRHDIQDDDWQQAMVLIGESMRTVASKMQVRFYRRDSAGQYQPVPLNMSAL